MSRKCPFTDCQTIINNQHFACSKHWFTLSEKHKAAINIAHSNYQKAKTIEEKITKGNLLKQAQQAALQNKENKII